MGRGTALSLTIEELLPFEILRIVNVWHSIHGKRHFSKKLLCNGIKPLTPEKTESKAASEGTVSSGISENSPDKQASNNEDENSTAAEVGKPLPHSPDILPVHENVKPLPLNQLAEDQAQEFTPANTGSQFVWPVFSDNNKVVRRHSISLTDRTPPPGSLAADILNLNLPTLPMKNSSKLMASIKDLRETLSDFNSCIESSGGSSSENEAEINKGGTGKKKRKRQKTPGKEYFLKKPNLEANKQLILIYHNGGH